MKAYLWWEPYLPAALSGIVSMVIGVCSGVIADLVTVAIAHRLPILGEGNVLRRGVAARDPGRDLVAVPRGPGAHRECL